MCRLFIAVDLAHHVRLEAMQKEMQARCMGRVKWEVPQNWHLTLQFLGEVDVSTSVIDTALLNIAAECAPFSLVLEGIGCFGPLFNPKVLWVGVQDHPSLSQLQQQVHNSMIQLGIKLQDSRFRPHVTLARVNHWVDSAGLSTWMQGNADAAIATVRVESFQLFRSVLSPHGATYKVIRDYKMEAEQG